MLRFTASELGISQGTAQIVSDFDTDGPFWTGSGERESRQSIEFPDRFHLPPSVQLAVVMWDSDGGTNQRGDVTAENITARGFELVFKTWGDSRIGRLRVQWTAIGPLPDDSDFIL